MTVAKDRAMFWSVDDAITVLFAAPHPYTRPGQEITGNGPEVCNGCAGWLIDVDNDASITGVMDAPIPCYSCCFPETWTEVQWAAFRARLDRIVAAWTLFYGPADPRLVAERREWIRERHAHQPIHLVG